MDEFKKLLDGGILDFQQGMFNSAIETLTKAIELDKRPFYRIYWATLKREHLILTHRKIDNSKQVLTFDSIPKLLEYLSNIDEDAYVIGGATIYKELMPYTSKMLLTHIEDTHKADVYFPKFDDNDWKKEELDSIEENNVKYKHCLYKRKK